MSVWLQGRGEKLDESYWPAGMRMVLPSPFRAVQHRHVTDQLRFTAMTDTEYRGEFLNLLRDGNWEYASRVHGNQVAVIIAITADHELVLVEQYRIPVASYTIELPAGLIGDDPQCAGETAIQAAARELEEETGYSPSCMKLMLRTPTSTGLTDETAVFFQARGLRRVSAGGGDDTEDIKVHCIALGQVGRWLKQQYQEGKAIDPKIYSALYWISHPESLPD